MQDVTPSFQDMKFLTNTLLKISKKAAMNFYVHLDTASLDNVKFLNSPETTFSFYNLDTNSSIEFVGFI
ncbi:hypothetical protein [Lactobacillus terrae]|uniref:hypothetical protein n=1 Tax=Lactobacillus terrae TaxID=2269374 RepID=UPI000C1B670E|nr:hypothetical protein [Lactobacillus terrae]